MESSSSKGKKGSTKKPGQIHKYRDNQAGKVQSIKTYFEAKAGGQASNLGRKGDEDRSAGPQDPTLGKEPEEKL